ncbi:hypothetical protein AVEN_240358-2-1, partial [Araneus ventricosus]
NRKWLHLNLSQYLAQHGQVWLLRHKTKTHSLTVTIPRQELRAAELLSKLISNAVLSLNLKIDKIYLYSDSTIVLAWINTSPHLLKVFVSNRISRIHELTKDFSWHHVKTSENAADIISRFMTPQQLLDNSLRWNGPQFIQQVTVELSDTNDIPTDDDYLYDLKREFDKSPALSLNSTILDSLLSISNNYSKLIGVESQNLPMRNFDTILHRIEGILNSHSLTPLSSDMDDLEFLTPRHFLIGRPITAIAEPNLTNVENNRLNLWQKTSKIVRVIWKRWQNNYLSILQQKNKWMIKKQNLKVGDIVLLKEENLTCCKRILGRIVDVLFGKDNVVRVVNVKPILASIKDLFQKLLSCH